MGYRSIALIFLLVFGVLFSILYASQIVWLSNSVEIETRPALTEEEVANITRADMKKEVAPMHVDKFVLFPTYYGHPLALVFVHENGTQYYINSGDTCTATADTRCNMGSELADAVKGHLVYIVDGSWQDSSIGNCNHFIYAVDAKSGMILWSYVEQEEIGSCPVSPPGW